MATYGVDISDVWSEAKSSKMAEKRARDENSKPAEESKSFSDLFSMADSRSEESGKYYFLMTDSGPRKDVTVARTNARTPQFVITYRGANKKLTIPISDKTENWQYELAEFIELKLKVPNYMVLDDVHVEVNEDGSITDASMIDIQENVKEAYKALRKKCNQI